MIYSLIAIKLLHDLLGSGENIQFATFNKNPRLAAKIIKPSVRVFSSKWILPNRWRVVDIAELILCIFDWDTYSPARKKLLGLQEWPTIKWLELEWIPLR